ncbi:hypothetical protein CSUI_000125 [Cystoisospora suis]|uniref:Uncharacterized protein n=1 Tax=Cystoisospora suis TaxID=483139 RepID=A0A2C6L290_9APIC|nr:hypothetical protein CSUI_000125 [Cystoisospora suis]
MYLLTSSPMARPRRVFVSAFPVFPFTSSPGRSRWLFRATVETGRPHTASQPSPDPVSALHEYCCSDRNRLPKKSLSSSECLSPRFLVQDSPTLSRRRLFFSGCNGIPPCLVRRRRESLTSSGGSHPSDSSFLPHSSSFSPSSLSFSDIGFPYHSSMYSACAALTGEVSRRLGQPLVSCLASRGRQRHMSSSTSNSSTSSPSTLSSSSASPGLSPRFRSAVHREMVVSVTRTHLQNLLLRRFGTFRTQECRVIKSREFTSVVLSRWAAVLVDQNLRLDGENGSILAYSAPPFDVLKDSKVKNLIARDLEVRWFVNKLIANNVSTVGIDDGEGGQEGDEDERRIKKVQEGDHIPQPHFPSVLRQDHPQYPYEPYEMEKLRDLYGVLLKWPYRERGLVRSVAMRRAELERRQEEKELLEAGVREDEEPGRRKSRLKEGSTEKEEKPEAAGQLRITTGCSDNYIYAPSEMETGLYKEM